MAFIWGVALLMIPVDASQCQHKNAQTDRSVLLQHAVKKHEHNASGHQLFQPDGKIGNYGCSNYASSELKKTWKEFPYECDMECGQTAGCVGWAFLTTSDTTCKGSDQSKGSCTLWKETCAPDYSSSCQAWAQYTMGAAPQPAPAPPPACCSGCTSYGGTSPYCSPNSGTCYSSKAKDYYNTCCTPAGQDMWASGTKVNCCPILYGPKNQECLVDGKYMCLALESGTSCPAPAPAPPTAHHGSYHQTSSCTEAGQDMWATGQKVSCCDNPYGPEIKECLVDGKYMCMEYQCPQPPAPPPAHHSWWSNYRPYGYGVNN